MAEGTSTITLSKRGAKRLRSGHPWGFRGEVLEASSSLEPGEVVDAVDQAGYLVGRGFYNPGSLIAFRMVTREPVALDEGFWSARLAHALALRDVVVPEEDTACRLVHAEADGIPGLIVDRYGDILVLQSLTAGIDRALAMWTELLAARTGVRGILARNDPRPGCSRGCLKSGGCSTGRFPGRWKFERMVTGSWLSR